MPVSAVGVESLNGPIPLPSTYILREKIMNVAERKQSSTVVPPIRGSVEDAMRALLSTPPPPPGDPSTRKQMPIKKAKKR